MNILNVSNYLKFVEPDYSYIQIIPHKSIRNYNSSNLINSISNTYKTIENRIHKEQKQLLFERNYKISYIVDLSHNNTEFYFIIPTIYKPLLVEKMTEIWSKATIKEIDDIEQLSNESSTYELMYKNDDALSLSINKSSNEPLNSIMNITNSLQDDDIVRIAYNFIPINQGGWHDRYNEMHNKFKQNKPLERKMLSLSYIIKSSLGIVLTTLDGILEILQDFTGSSSNSSNTDTIYSSVMNIIQQHNGLSKSTKKKETSTIINTQIAVISQSKNKIRMNNNAVSVCQAYNSLAEDNQLLYNKTKKNINIEDYDFGIENNLCSTDECQNFIQIPARELLQKHKINYVKTEETSIPIELQQGTKLLGNSTYKSKITPSYLENDYSNGNLPLSLIGSQGGGKSTYIKHYTNDCIKANESVIILDIIKDCDVANKIESICPKNKLVVLDLSKESDLQGFGFNEISINDSLSNYKRCEMASLQSQEVMSFIDSISTGEPLSPKMRRYLNSSANVVFSLGYSSIKDVVRCLESFEFRELCLNNLNSKLKELLSDEISTLKELNEYTKPTKDNPNVEVCGTRDSKIEYILDRISILRENFKFKYMYNKSLDKNINLIDCMNKGKVVLIKMRESDFPTKVQKNIMVTYWISKIWLSCQLRGSSQNQPLRCNVVIDEVFQAPTSMNILQYILPQSRKFGLKFILSSQYTKQLDKLFDTLEASGSSFMLLTGSTENDFNYFKEKLTNFEYEDLRDMEQFSAMCLIKYSKGYSNFIVKLPYDKKLD